MAEMKKKYGFKMNISTVFFLAGMVIVLFQMIPYIVLGEDTVITYHDQLDGEMIAYILQAKWLFRGDVIPEFMGGSLKTALTLPAPGFLLLFCIGNYFGAYVFMHLIEMIVAYIGMYLLAKEVKCNSFMAVLLAGIFAYLPFLPVYGLAQFGIPLLLWFQLRIRKNKNYVGAVIYSCVYALCSSLVLVGFGVIFIMFVEIMLGLIKKKFKFLDAGEKKSFVIQILCLGSLITVYFLENLRLILQILGIGNAGDVVSHKSEYVLRGEDFFTTLTNMFFEGGSHSLDYHFYIMLGSIVGICVCAVVGKKRIKGKDWKNLAHVGGWILFFVLLAGFWDSNASKAIREGIGIFGSVSLTRVMWIAPSMWYLFGAMVLGNLESIRKESEGKTKNGAVIAVAFFVIVLGIAGFRILWNGNYPANVCRIIGREYSSISFEEYYAVGVLDKVQEYIYETTQEAPEDYRVLSLGIDPAAAYYNGFYCLDGYSNNYSLEYKHKFRKIIEPELNKNEYLRTGFDGWGNRCYLCCAQIPGYYTFEKYTSYFWDYDINAEAAKEMGAKYILSSVYLVDAQKDGLRLVREEPFEAQDSYYAIYLYAIE